TQLTQLSLSLKTTCFFMVFILMDESFRLSFLFKENAEHFIETFSECRPRMFQFLSDLEETAVKLDRMTKGSSISSVAGSSVGIAGGVMSIIGLGLAPFTAGLSLGLTMTGLGLGVTSGVNSIVSGPNVAFTAGNVAYKPITVKLAKRTPLALSKTARAGFVGLNVLFIGLDIYSICSESKSLAKGEQCRMSQLIRSRSSLWRTEINNWDRMKAPCLCQPMN
uniref:Si:ch73-233k15.2 n=1 Tax=Astyanax mexicanus TaxID=7994 RepID=A0A8B9GTK6_ASTMX